MQYRAEGFLPEALLNTLARLGWSHGDEEIFSRQQLVEWFDLAHVSHSPAQFDPEKALWMNQQYIKAADDVRLSGLTELVLGDMGIDARGGPPIDKVVALLKDRANSVVHLAAERAPVLCYEGRREDPRLAQEKKPGPRCACSPRSGRDAVDANPGAPSRGEKSTGLKGPELAMPRGLPLVTGRTQTPALERCWNCSSRETVPRAFTPTERRLKMRRIARRAAGHARRRQGAFRPRHGRERDADDAGGAGRRENGAAQRHQGPASGALQDQIAL